MVVSVETRILLLLTAGLGTGGKIGPPLDASGFDQVTAWLKRTRLKPADLLEPDLLERLSWAPPPPVPLDRLVALLRRAPLLDEALNRWAGSGLWVIGRGDPDYPRRMKRRLRAAAPPLLFGAGDRLLLNRGGIALVGGATDAEPVGYAARFAARAAAVGLATLSGTGNAVEEAALLGSLSRGGIAVAVLPDGLEREVAGGRLRGMAGDGQLAFVSSAEPESGFDGARGRAGAMRCLYGLSDAALLVALGRDNDRWVDAVEAIEADWVPHWVRAGDAEAGSLIRLGARIVPDDEVAPRALLVPPARPPARARSRTTMDFFAPAPGPVLVGFAEEQAAFPAPPPPPAPSVAPPGRAPHLRLVETQPRVAPPPVQAEPEPEQSLYELFAQRLAALLAHGPLGLTRVAEAMELTRPQVEAWLTRAEAEARVRVDPVTRLFHLP